jgi:hypothetical protein
VNVVEKNPAKKQNKLQENVNLPLWDNDQIRGISLRLIPKQPKPRQTAAKGGFWEETEAIILTFEAVFRKKCMKTMKKIYSTPQMDVLTLATDQPLLSASSTKSWLTWWLVYDDPFDGVGDGLEDGGSF